MGFRDFIAMFWPLLAVYVAAGLLAVLVAFALSRMRRRREVRRMHKMRRWPI